MNKFALSFAGIALMAGCESLPSGAGDILGKSVDSYEAPVLKTATLRLDGPQGPNRVRSPKPPRTFFFNGQPAPDDNYFLREKNKAIIPAASRVVANSRIRGYLHGIAQKLMENVPGGAPEIQVHVLGSPSYEAFARENGDVYISINALATAASEDEIATLMGHEIAHVLLNHHEKDKIFSQQRDATSALVGGAIFASYLVAVGKSSIEQGRLPSALSPSARKQVQQDSLVMMGIKMGTDFVGNDIFNANWNRNQENEADLLGLDLAEAAGYDPYAAYNGFARLIEALQNRRTRISLLETKAEKRIAGLEATLAAGNFSVDQFIETGIDVGGDFIKAVAGDARDFVADRYSNPEKREERAGEYLDRFYPDVAVEQNERSFARTQRRLKVVQINNAYAKVAEAQAQLVDADFDEAVRTLRQAYRIGPISRDPYPRTLEAIALQGVGDDRRALSAIKKASPSVPLSLEGYFIEASLEGRVGRKSRAIRAVEEATKAYGAEATQPKRIGTLVEIGRADDARKALVECSQMSANTKRACEEAATLAGLIAPERQSGGLGDLLGGALGGNSNTGPASTSIEDQIGETILNNLF